MNYTNITFESLLQDFKSRLASDERFANISSASIYQMFMEMICASMDMTNYYMQRVAEEGFIDTAKLDSSVIKHCKNLGYNPRRRIPATCDLQIQIKGPLPSNLKAGDKVVFDRDTVDLVYNSHKYKLNASYAYTFVESDLAGIGSNSWKKILSFAVPTEQVEYLPLQGRTMYNSKNLEKISCFQGEVETYVIQSNANTSKVSKNGQFYDINDTTFSNWYSFRDPYAFKNDNYTAALSWTKVGIGNNEDEAFSPENLFDIEDSSIYLNENIQKSTDVPSKPFKVCLIESNYDKTVRLRFGNDNYLTCPGLTKFGENIYVRYLKTDGIEANQTGTAGAFMTNNSTFYLYHAGEIIDMTNNISFIIASDISGGEEFESQTNMKINAVGYFSSRLKLVTKKDFVSYFRTITYPLNVQSALVYSQNEIEDNANIIYKYVQNYVFYSLIGHMYLYKNGRYTPRDIFNNDDSSDSYWSLYGNEYLNREGECHICDYVKMIMSFDSFYNQQYDDEPQTEFLKNVKSIRKNAQPRMELNSRILSLPPFVQYFDVVGTVTTKKTIDLNEYKETIENQIYEYLDNQNSQTQKIYKSDIIKFFTDNEYTKSVDIDIKVSEKIKSDNRAFTWLNDSNILNGGSKFEQIPSLQNVAAYGSTPDQISKTLGSTAWFNSISLTGSDYYGSEITKSDLKSKRIKVNFTFNTKQGNKQTVTQFMKFGTDIDYDDTTSMYNIAPIYPIIFDDKTFKELYSIELYLPEAGDFYSQSKFNVQNKEAYRLSNTQINKVETMLNDWLGNGLEITTADRAIPLPYSVYASDTLTHEETYFRKGYLIGDYETTISERSFWMYFVPKLIKAVYGNKINEKSSVDSIYWKGATKLIFDIYPLVKPALCDNVLDAHNNIVNFSLDNEVAVVRLNLTYGNDRE